MCEGFGVVVAQDGKVWFMEPDQGGNISHENIILRLIGYDVFRYDIDTIPGKLVRIEFPEWTEESYSIDEAMIPGWFEGKADEYREFATKLMLRVKKEWTIVNRKNDRLHEAWNRAYVGNKNNQGLNSEHCTTRWLDMWNKKEENYQKFVSKISKFRGYVGA